MKSFEFLKKGQFRKLDKSDEGHIDMAILPLLKKINSKKDYYTTSSCSGRIVLIKGKEQKQKNLFLFKTHDKIGFSELKKELRNAVKGYNDLIYFKMESCILHAACSTLQKAQELLDRAKLAGWKKTGIITFGRRIVCEIASTEKLEMPIANKGKILADDSLLRIIMKEANKKLARTWQKIKKLEKII